MIIDTSMAVRSKEENWLPVLELAIQEVFEIMLGCRPRSVPRDPQAGSGEFTAMVGLAGELCGILTLTCDQESARDVARRMLGPEIADSAEQVSDALGEICNMIAGNFKNKLAGTDGRCMLSVPTVIKGEEYTLRSLADGENMEVIMEFEGKHLVVNLQLHP